MANDNAKARGVQLIRADRAVAGVVTFYDTRESNVGLARIGSVSFAGVMEAQGYEIDGDMPACVIKAALHGWTQNILDSSNKLSGDERVAFVAKACETINAGGWVSAPVDEEAAREQARKAIDKMVTQGFIDAAMGAKMKSDAGL